ncbi:MAG: TetR/AcrR family transcriptional regulator [Candidatus Dormibacteria bacterium]
MGRPREHGEKTRLALLGAAESLVAARGLDALSVRAMAADIGSSVRAVYSVFGSKHGLMVALAQRGFQLLMNEVDSVPLTGDPAADLVRAATLGFRPFVLGHPDLFKLLFIQSDIKIRPDVDDASEEAFGRLGARLERAGADGVVPDRPVAELGMEFHALCQGLATLELCGAMPPGQAERIWTHSFEDLVAGWRARAVATGTVARGE